MNLKVICASLYVESSIADDFDNFRSVTDEKKAGPNRANTDHCGTPAITIVVAETVPPKRTNWVLLSMYNVIHRRTRNR